MNLMFWKKKPAGDAAASEAAPGLLARLKAQVAVLIGRFKSPPPFKAEVPASAETSAPSAKKAPPGPDVPPAPAGAFARMKSGLRTLLDRLAVSPEGETSPVRRMGLIAVGIMLLSLLLGAFGYAVWTIVRSAPDSQTDVTELIEEERANAPPLPIFMPESAPAASAPADAGVSAVSAASSVEAHAPQTELEALRQKNAELQAQVDALNKAQQSSSTSVKLYSGGGKGAAAGGVATVGNSDPKATAATLKEAIEAMNKGRNYQETPTK